MRCIPTALAVPDRSRRLRESMRICAITHDDPRCTVACAAYNEIVVALVDGAPASNAVDIGAATAAERGNQVVAGAISLGKQLKLAAPVQTGQTGRPDDGNGFVLDSLSLAVAGGVRSATPA
jgi:ADP-ribosylglycohydrolase